jgi:anaerobic dimethyl sulfoxide reductase subunit B (iron-sulfur subunit)
MSKCNFCIDRFSDGKLPVCIEACRTHALDAGSFEDLKKKYGKNQIADNFSYSDRTKPAIIFKPKK